MTLDRESVKMHIASRAATFHLEFENIALAARFRRDRQLLIESVLRRATTVPDLTDLEYTERLKCMNLPSMNLVPTGKGET